VGEVIYIIDALNIVALECRLLMGNERRCGQR